MWSGNKNNYTEEVFLYQLSSNDCVVKNPRLHSGFDCRWTIIEVLWREGMLKSFTVISEKVSSCKYAL